MSPLEAELKEKLAKLREIKSARDDKCALLEVQIKAMQEDLSEMSKPFDDEYKTVESGVREIVLQLACPFRTKDGEVKFRNGGIRVTYESKPLDKICAGNVEIQKLLAPFRKETKVSPSVTVEVF